MKKVTKNDTTEVVKENDKDINLKEIEMKYSKAELISSAKYIKHRDILNVLLLDESSYTYKQVDELLDNFMKGMV